MPREFARSRSYVDGETRPLEQAARIQRLLVVLQSHVEKTYRELAAYANGDTEAALRISELLEAASHEISAVRTLVTWLLED